MSVTIRAQVVLSPGCRLLYDCPDVSGDYNAQQFFEKYRGKYATFVDYYEELVSILDHKGRLPGRYRSLKDIRVRFDGDESIRSMNLLHFVVVDKTLARFVDTSDQDERLGDLPHPVLFYPGDTVRFKKKPKEGLSDEVRKVGQTYLGVPVSMTDVPRYEVIETEEEMRERIQKFREENQKRPPGEQIWSSAIHLPQGLNTAGEDIELVDRGNIWALYNNPGLLSFHSDEEELEFWSHTGISGYVSEKVKERVLKVPLRALQTMTGLSLEDAYRVFEAGEADHIKLGFNNQGDEPRYETMRLHDCFGKHRERIRALTVRLWRHQLKESAA